MGQHLLLHERLAQVFPSGPSVRLQVALEGQRRMMAVSILEHDKVCCIQTGRHEPACTLGTFSV